jgi:hypothetical protein
VTTDGLVKRRGLCLEFIDHPVGATQPTAQLATEIRQKLDGDCRSF